MDWNQDGKQDWQDDFITQKLLSDSGGRTASGCLTALLAMLATGSVLVLFLLH